MAGRDSEHLYSNYKEYSDTTEMKLAVLSANLGSFEKPIDDGRITITEKEFPLRDKSMTARLQARIVKTHMWQFVPGYDYYLWIDSSCRLKSKQWFLEQLGEADIAVFKHPHRETVQEEADYLKERLELESSGKKQKYILPRYENEDIDGQLEHTNSRLSLFASTAFIYKNNSRVRDAMERWWYYISRYHSIDQLSFPQIIAVGQLKVNVIQDNYENCDGMEFIRNK